MWNGVHRHAVRVLIAVGTVSGCSHVAPGAVRRVSVAELNALPVASVVDGRKVCMADGRSPCPLHSALANWLSSDSYALWEPGNQVRVYDRNDSAGRTIGNVGHGEGSYGMAAAVGPDHGGTAIVDASRNTVVRFDSHGQPAGEVVLAAGQPDDAHGFVGSVPVLQELRPEPPGDTAVFKLIVLNRIADTVGDVAVQVPLGWLVVKGGKPVHPTPFFPAVPRYAVYPDRSVIWTPGDSFEIQRRVRGGGLDWTLTSDRTGDSVTTLDIARRRRELEDQTDPHDVPASDIDSMVARTAPHLPVISGLSIAPDGSILISGSLAPSRDSVEYLVLTKAGVPRTRFKLPSRTAVLLFGGDSLLVHRPTEGEPWEVRWLALRGTANK